MKLFVGLTHLITLECSLAKPIVKQGTLRGLSTVHGSSDTLNVTGFWSDDLSGENVAFLKQLAFSTSQPPAPSPVIVSSPTSPDFKCDDIKADDLDEYTEKIEGYFEDLSDEDNFDESSDRMRAFEFIREEQFCGEKSAIIQRYIAALFYYATDGDNWDDSSNWLSADNECDWGKTVCNNDGEITLLSNDNNSLGGTLPSEMFALESLVALDLDSNNIGGTLPDNIGDSSNLITLDLDSNSFFGTIPRSLYTLEELESLDIDNNKFSGTIHRDIGDLESLTFLSMYANTFTGTIPRQIGDLDKLEVAYFDDNDFTGSVSDDICDLVEKEDLTVLTVDCNGNPPEVECSCCSGCGQSDNGVCPLIGADTIADYDERIKTILGEVSGPGAFDDDNSKRSLALTFIRDERFCGEESALVQRYVAALFYYSTEGDDWLNATNWLSSQDECDWGKTGCNGAGEITIINNDENNVGGTLPFELCNLPSLGAIDLDGNQIGGPIFGSIGDCQNLVNFDVDNNELTGTIPESLFSITGLVNLDLDNNKLEGTLSSEVGNLENLENLSLWGNGFTGTIPVDIANLEALSVAYFDTNEFSGAMPDAICPLVDNGLKALTSDCLATTNKVTCNCCTDCA